PHGPDRRAWSRAQAGATARRLHEPRPRSRYWRASPWAPVGAAPAAPRRTKDSTPERHDIRIIPQSAARAGFLRSGFGSLAAAGRNGILSLASTGTGNKRSGGSNAWYGGAQARNEIGYPVGGSCSRRCVRACARNEDRNRRAGLADLRRGEL